MKLDNIFVGNIKECLNYYPYVMHGDKREVKDFRLGNMIESHIESYTRVYKENALLLRTKNGNYVDLECFESYLDIIKLNLMANTKIGFEEFIIKKSPDKNNDLFVYENSLTPCDNLPKEIANISGFKLIKKNKKASKK